MQRDQVTMGLAENGGNPEDHSCYLSVSAVEVLFQELQNKQLDISPIRLDVHEGHTNRVFFLRAPDGLCFCFGQKQETLEKDRVMEQELPEEVRAMLAHNDIIAFIATTQPEQARVFYSEVLGLRLVEDTPFALVFEANGTMLRIQKVQTLTPAGHTVLGWHVVDIHEAVQMLQKRGVIFNRYPGLSQDEQGIWTAPDGNKIAWFSDLDGNILSLTEIRHNSSD
ncbi:MAG: VOC family protein [Chloroflexota bacterium]|nr:VOC family protein [Chloroflexota bacterium]